MDTISCELAAYHQEAAIYPAAVCDGELRKNSLEDGRTVLGHLRQLAKGECVPIFPKRCCPLLTPSGVVADAGDAGEEIEVAHHFAEYDRRDRFQPLRHTLDVQEPNSAGTDQEVNVVAGDLVFICWEIHVVFHAQAELGQFERRRVVGVPLAHDAEFPSALRGERGELSLPQDVRSEAVRIGAGFALSIGDQVDLAVSLFEGLPDAVVLKPATPMEDGLHVGGSRMPKPRALVSSEVNFALAGIDEAPVMPDSQ